MLNKLLQRQLKKHLNTDEIPEKYASLFSVISQSYDHHERDRKMLVHSIELSSEEMMQMNNILRAEAANLKKANEQIEQLFKNINEIYLSIDIKNSCIQQISAACETITGYTQAEFMADFKLWEDIVHPEDKYILDGNRAEFVQGKSVINQYRIIHKNGSIRWIEGKIIPLFDEEKRVIRLDAVSRDITEKKIDEEKILHTQYLLKEAQQIGKMGSWNHDYITGEILWSKGLYDILGIDEEIEPSLELFQSLIHEEDKEAYLSEVTQLRNQGSSIELTYRLIRLKDQAVRIFNSYINAERDINGKLTRLYGISQDITERRQVEMKIERLNMLIYQIGHDIRGPINSAKNYIYLASTKVHDKTALAYIDKIQSSYTKIENYLLSMLNLQRLNRSETIIEQINIHELIQQVMHSIDSVPGFNKVKILSDVDIDMSFSSDRQYLHSIIYNLINNAITYRRDTDDSFIHISSQRKNNTIIISISDNGIGINEESKLKIFEMFYKEKEASEGFGLGLYIVKSLVERLKGEISLESSPMNGTTFTICLPDIQD